MAAAWAWAFRRSSTIADQRRRSSHDGTETCTRQSTTRDVTPDAVLEAWSPPQMDRGAGVRRRACRHDHRRRSRSRISTGRRRPVLVDRQEVSEAFVRPSVTAELETRIQTIHQRVTSRARLADLINRLGLYPELRAAVPVEVIVERMRRDIQLQLKGVEQSTGRSTTISFSVGYSGRNRAECRRRDQHAGRILRRREHQQPGAPGRRRRPNF